MTNKTRKILGDEKGELKDHYLTLTRDDLNDPNLNICAGVRWLFQKAKIASSLKGREATWEEAVAEFKGVRLSSESRATELLESYRRIEERIPFWAID